MKINVTENGEVISYFINHIPKIEDDLLLESSEKFLKGKCEKLNTLHKEETQTDKDYWNVYRVIFTDYHIEKI